MPPSATGESHDASWLSILRCPFCGHAFSRRAVATPSDPTIGSGLLQCTCSVFPIVDGIPIVQRARVGVFEHTTGGAQVDGPEVADLVRLIERGRTRDALAECLTIPAPVPLARYLPWRVRNHAAMRRVVHWRGRRSLLRDVITPAASIGADAVFDYFFRPGRLDAALGAYFRLRLGQPRYLAALALLANVKPSDRPVLDIGCGIGHFEHYLTQRADPVGALGVDMNFFQLWIARRWMAPDARFVCANAEDGLPLASDAFSAVVCSDAYHYVKDRQRLLQEIRRCAPGRPVYLTRVGNAAVMPNEGREQTVRGYLDEIGEAAVLAFGERTLVMSYLKQRNPLAAAAPDPCPLEETKWLSFVWNAPAPVDPPWVEGDWPHAVGVLGLNPIYQTRRESNGDLRLQFVFPLPWFAYENHEMLSYHPRIVTVPQARVDRITAGPTDPAVRALIESFVLIGEPRRFRSRAAAPR